MYQLSHCQYKALMPFVRFYPAGWQADWLANTIWCALNQNLGLLFLPILSHSLFFKQNFSFCKKWSG